MNELAWTALRAETIDRFQGQTPRPEDEAPIIDIFESHPQLVQRAIDETAKALADGKITWAWSVVRARLERGTNALREATADTSTSRLKLIENAKRWIENAGCHYDLQRHIEAELFGDDFHTGRLQDLKLTDHQRQELVDHWHTHRPRGVEAERLHLEWMAKCGGGPQRMREILAARKARQEATCESTSLPCPEPDSDAGSSRQESGDAESTTIANAGADIAW